MSRLTCFLLVFLFSLVGCGGGSGGESADAPAVNYFYFFGNDDAGSGNWEPWRTDGTSNGTTKLKDLNAYAGSGHSGQIAFHYTSKGVFFLANDGVHGRELWFSNGYASSTRMVRDIHQSGDVGFRFGGELNGIVYFQGNEPEGGSELWRTDGKQSGTRRVRDIIPGACGSSPDAFHVLEGKLFFRALSECDGHPSLWVTEGSSQTTQEIYSEADVQFVATVGDQLYFTTYHEDVGEIWSMNPADHSMQKIFSGSQVTGLIPVGDRLHFLVRSYGGNHILWVFHPDQEEEPQLVMPEWAHFNDTSLGTHPLYWIFDDVMYFTTDYLVGGRELFRTDESGKNVFLLHDIRRGSDGNSNPDSLVKLGDHIFFTANDGNERAVWKTDGTKDGTVKAIPLTVFDNANVRTITNYKGLLVLVVGTHDMNRKLWVSDGTEEGTWRLLPESDMVVDNVVLKEHDGLLYFKGHDELHGREYWRTDGTTEGTFLLRDVCPGTCAGISEY